MEKNPSEVQGEGGRVTLESVKLVYSQTMRERRPCVQAKAMRVIVAALKDKSVNDDKLIVALRQPGTGTGAVQSRLARKSSLSNGTATLQPSASVESAATREGLAVSRSADQDGEAVLFAQIQVLQERLAGRDRQLAELQDLLMQRNAQLAEGFRASGDAPGQDLARQYPPSGVPVLVEDADV